MSSFNRVILMGNLTRDPEIRQSQTGTCIAKVVLAVNERMPDGNGGWKDQASFFDIVIFGKRADAFGRFMAKGRTVLIEGKLRQNRWQDKETGQNRSKIEVIVDSWEFAGGPQNDQGGAAPNAQAPGFPSDQGAPPGSDFPDDTPF